MPKICSRHEISEILLKLALNTNQSIEYGRCIVFVWEWCWYMPMLLVYGNLDNV